MKTAGLGSRTAILMTQKWLPLKTQAFGNLSWHLAFNAARQSYSVETVMRYLSLTLGLTEKQSLRGAVRLSVLALDSATSPKSA